MDKKDIIQLIEKSLQGTLTPEERERLSSYEQHFQTAPHPFESKSDSEKDRIKQQIKNKLSIRINSQQAQYKIPSRRFGWMKIAASVTVVLGLLFSIYHFTMRSSKSYTTVYTTGQEIIQKILPDGSIIYLNKGAKLELQKDFGQNNRSVRLRGEAYFNVKRNTSLPFEIVTDQGFKVRVLGTRFNIRSYSSAPSVALVSGKVALAHEDGTRALLSPGEVAFSMQHGFEIKKMPLDNFISWKPNGVFIDDMALEDLFTLLAKRFDIDIQTDSKSLRSSRISFTLYEEDDIQDIMELIRVVKHLKYIQTANKFKVYTAE